MAIKSKPTGVRFDLEKVAFIKQWEKLKSNQQVVDFLMNKYWWEKKMPVPTYKEVPPLNLKESVNYFDIPKVSVNNLNYSAPKKVKTVIDYVEERIECDNREGYNKWLNELENDPNLTKKQKELAKTAQP